MKYLVIIAALALGLTRPALALDNNNWGGYYLSAGGYTSASGQWRVPSPVFVTTNAGSNQQVWQWVGIGGIGNNLIQVGTQVNFSSLGAISLTGWYQLANTSGGGGGAIAMGSTVKPGDIITASVTCTAACTAGNAGQTWTVTLTDVTQGWGPTSVAGLNWATQLDTAEWVNEAPGSFGSSGSVLPNFGSVPFVNAMVNGSPAVLSGATILRASNNQSPAQTSAPGTPSGSSFNDCWGLPATTYTSPCTAAGTLALTPGSFGR